MLSTESYVVLQYNLSKRLARDQCRDLVSLDQAKAEAIEEMSFFFFFNNTLKNSLTKMNTCFALRFGATEKNGGTTKRSAQREKLGNKGIFNVVEPLQH